MDPNSIAKFISLLVFLPAIVALVISVLPLRDEQLKWISLLTLVAVFLMTMAMLFGWSDAPTFDAGVAQMQNLFKYDWIPSFGIQYMMGTDGISFPSLC